MLELSQQPALEQRQEPAGKKILVVDDEAIIRDLCMRALKGYTVLQAGNGEEALQLFERGGVDVILSDVMMPKMNGIELLRRVKELDPTLVVIIMTGFAEKDVILNALKADADDFIAKPLNLLQLKTAVDKALVKKALKEEVSNLRQLDRLKTEFLSLVSHKFRTPLTSISLFLQNLAAGVYEPGDENHQKNLRLVYDETCYLERLVADLLDFSRLMDSSSGLRREPCQLDALVTEILSISREAHDRPGIETLLALAPLPVLALDRTKISFAFKQIIDNAYKFSKVTGTVSISLTGEESHVTLVVQDTGIGLPRDEIPKIFEKFYQVDPSHTGQIRGFGLGLFYAREFIRQHGGTITVDSEPGHGTTVTVILPTSQV